MTESAYSGIIGKCDLNDPVSLYLLCSCFLENVIREISVLTAGADDIDDSGLLAAGRAFMNLEDRFASLVSGCTASVPVSPLVRDGTVANGIRLHFAARLIALPEKERDLLCRDDAIFLFAVEMFRREICLAAREVLPLRSGGDESRLSHAEKARNLCIRWTEIFSGRKYPREIFPPSGFGKGWLR